MVAVQPIASAASFVERRRRAQTLDGCAARDDDDSLAGSPRRGPPVGTGRLPLRWFMSSPRTPRRTSDRPSRRSRRRSRRVARLARRSCRRRHSAAAVGAVVAPPESRRRPLSAEDDRGGGHPKAPPPAAVHRQGNPSSSGTSSKHVAQPSRSVRRSGFPGRLREISRKFFRCQRGKGQENSSHDVRLPRSPAGLRRPGPLRKREATRPRAGTRASSSRVAGADDGAIAPVP